MSEDLEEGEGGPFANNTSGGGASPGFNSSSSSNSNDHPLFVSHFPSSLLWRRDRDVLLSLAVLLLAAAVPSSFFLAIQILRYPRRRRTALNQVCFVKTERVVCRFLRRFFKEKIYF